MIESGNFFETYSIEKSDLCVKKGCNSVVLIWT
jgi:hypothetical protein